MAEDHLEMLFKAREQMVEQRRKVGKTLAEPYKATITPKAREHFVAMQNAIEAIDRAIADEGGEPPRYQREFVGG